MGPSRRAAIAIALLGLLGRPSVGDAQEAVPAEARTLTITPAADLVHGDVVGLRGTGWPRGGTLARQCARGATTSTERCEGAFRIFWPGPAGNFRIGVRVEAVLDLEEPWDCRVRICQIVLWDDTHFNRPIGRIPLPFDPDGPDPPTPTASVTPNTGLVDGQEVDLEADGVQQQPGVASRALVEHCLVDGDEVVGCDRAALVLRATSSGHLEANVPASVGLRIDGTTHDCRSAACALRVSTDREASEDVLVPLAFDPAGPPPPEPTVTAAPTDDLVDGQAIVVDGSGFGEDTDFDIEQCPVGAPRVACDELTSVFSSTGIDGTFRIDTTATTLVHGRTGPPVDCRSSACELRVSVFAFETATYAFPLTFDPEAEAFQPRVTVDPATGLIDRQRVTVRGDELHPFGGAVGVIQCVGRPAVVGGSERHCDPRWEKVIESGTSFVTSYLVHRRIRTAAEGPVDCRVRHCRIWVYEAWRSDPAASERLLFGAP